MGKVLSPGLGKVVAMRQAAAAFGALQEAMQLWSARLSQEFFFFFFGIDSYSVP